MLPWAQCQSCLVVATPEHCFPALTTAGPATLTYTPRRRGNLIFALPPLHNGDISWGLEKRRPSYSRPSVASFKAHKVSTLRPVALGCDDSTPRGPESAQLMLPSPTQEAASTPCPKSSPHGANASELRSMPHTCHPAGGCGC